MKTFSFEDVISIAQGQRDILNFFDISELDSVLKDLDCNSCNYAKVLFHWDELRNDYKASIKNKIVSASKPAKIRESLLNKFGDDQFLVYKIIRPDYIEFVVFNKYSLDVNYNNNTDDLNISCIKIYEYKDCINIQNLSLIHI